MFAQNFLVYLNKCFYFSRNRLFYIGKEKNLIILFKFGNDMTRIFKMITKWQLWQLFQSKKWFYKYYNSKKYHKTIHSTKIKFKIGILSSQFRSIDLNLENKLINQY